MIMQTRVKASFRDAQQVSRISVRGTGQCLSINLQQTRRLLKEGSKFSRFEQANLDICPQTLHGFYCRGAEILIQRSKNGNVLVDGNQSKQVVTELPEFHRNLGMSEVQNSD